jgi:hypothetical protein
MRTFLKIHHPDPMISELRFQIFEIVQRPVIEPVYTSAGKLAKLQGIRQTNELETVRHLLGHGAVPLDAELMAEANGYLPWQAPTAENKP